MRAIVGRLAVVALLAGAVVGVPGPAAEADRTAHRLIVKYRAGVADIADRAARHGRVKRELAGGAVLIAGSDAVRRALAADPDVAYVERDELFQLAEAPNDPEYGKQWNLHDPTAGMNVPGAWTSTTGAGVTVAVIDTGYTKHSDLAQVVPGYDLIADPARARDGNGRDGDAADEGTWTTAGQCGATGKATASGWHGTYVAGIVGAVANNGKGVAGVAPGIKLQPIRVFGPCGGYGSDILEGIVWASGGRVPGLPDNPTPARVINLSAGGGGACSQAMQDAVSGAISRGAVVVNSAGNSNSDVANHSPSNCKGVISVGASTIEGNRAPYSNYGATLTITAPGGSGSGGILSTSNAGTTTPGAEVYRSGMGTSAAAPHVAGLVALMLAKRPSLTPAQVETVLKANARPMPGDCPAGCGAGLADAAKTIKALDVPPPTITVDNPGEQWSYKGFPIAPLQLSAKASNGAPVTFKATGLPPGLTITTAGRVSGTPTAAGTFTTTVTASASGGTGRVSFTWRVWGW
ncbi:S8 family peptidase [Actinokineospora soli]